jgi:hypothetical protein
MALTGELVAHCEWHEPKPFGGFATTVDAAYAVVPGIDNIWCVADPDIPANLQRGLAIARQIASKTYRKWPPV